MSISKSCGLAAVVVTSSIYFGNTASAQLSEEESQKRVDVVSDLALAAQLVSFGRGELNDTTGLKDFKSPEALVAAGGILLRIHKQTAGKLVPSDAQVLDDEGKPLAAEGAPASLADEASAIFDEARALPSKDKSSIEAQIKQAQMVPERGAVSGPRVISRTIKTGKAHTLKIGFAPNAPAAVTMRGTGQTQFEVVGAGGNVLWHSRGSWGIYQWHTGRGGLKDVTVKVINKGGPPVAYTVTTN